MDQLSIYIVDASSLIGLSNWRPPSKHRADWQKLDGLIQSDRLISPDEVYTEIKAGQDTLARWATRRKKRLLQRTTRQHAGFAKQIISRFPDFIESERPIPQADPFVVSLAVFESKQTLAQRCIVLTEEKYTPTGRTRIPHVCEAYGIPYMSIHQMYIVE